MNGSFYQNPTFPNATNPNNMNPTTPPGNISFQSQMPLEQSLIENILRLNKGKKVRAYVSYPDSNEWRDRIYEGRIEDACRDHFIISDANTGVWYLIRMIYLNYVEFEEKINYNVDYSDTFD